ncbi:MAG: outer membrane protein Omp28 [Bacteroidetes bacterium]|jgi:hypothetical protein|nr:outer membrane protein Omp28 [Bacteroidota bacterium]
MKKLSLFIGICVSGLVFNSCDYVSNVMEPGQNTGNGGNGSADSGMDSTIFDTVILRKALIEDYTGHRCGNCPAAAEDLHRIDSIYAGKVIPMAIHAGGFAAVNVVYPTDLRTPEGTTFDSDFHISDAGNPNGLVNRKGFGTSDFIVGWTLWETNAAPAVAEIADFKISINNTYNAGTRQLTSAVTVTANQDMSGTYNLSVLLLEDSIIAEQLDYRLPTGQQLIQDYNFMHVLRASLNSTWGQQIFSGSWAKGRYQIKRNSIQLAANIVPEHCHIIAFIYNADNSSSSYYEVRQVEESHVTH